jgi:hypothetical protein
LYVTALVVFGESKKLIASALAKPLFAVIVSKLARVLDPTASPIQIAVESRKSLPKIAVTPT